MVKIFDHLKKLKFSKVVPTAFTERPMCRGGGRSVSIRPLALGRKNYLFAGNHDAAVRAAIVYSLFSCCKAAGIDTRSWLEDVLRRIPTEKNPEMLLPGHWTLTNR